MEYNIWHNLKEFPFVSFVFESNAQMLCCSFAIYVFDFENDWKSII